ncbi:MAG: hypothetical protein ACYS8W_05290 [Planctomycetota bacterium]|jgi:hypothetical protein
MSERKEPKIVCIADANPGAGAVELAAFLLRHFPDWSCAKIEFDDEAGPSVWIERKGEKILASSSDTGVLAAAGALEIIKVGVHPDLVDEAIETVKRELPDGYGVFVVGALAPSADMAMVATIPDMKPDPLVRVHWDTVSTAVFLRGRLPEGAVDEFFKRSELRPVPFLPLTGDLVNIVRNRLGLL